jgi:hypothetical protein
MDELNNNQVSTHPSLASTRSSSSAGEGSFKVKHKGGSMSEQKAQLAEEHEKRIQNHADRIAKTERLIQTVVNSDYEKYGFAFAPQWAPSALKAWACDQILARHAGVKVRRPAGEREPKSQPQGTIKFCDTVHVQAFQSFMKWAMEGGTDPTVAFVEAIAKTSDDAFANMDDRQLAALEHYTELVRR